MLAYWLMFSIPAVGALTRVRGSPALERILWALVGVLFVLLIGLRHQVGADWFNYLNHYYDTLQVPFTNALITQDPAYAALVWFSGVVGGGIYLVNLVCAFIVVAGVIVFCRAQPQPWLALVVAVPYMLIVVSMGYSRQGVALGFELLALTAITDGRNVRFVLLILIAALFHKSALIVLPIAALIRSRGFGTALWVGITGVLASTLLVAEHFAAMWEIYVEGGLTSEGVEVRVMMNAFAAVAFLFCQRRLTDEKQERRLWFCVALMALLAIPFMHLASTAVDRLALYFMPIQLYVFARIHRLAPTPGTRFAAVTLVVAGYGVVQWVWLNYANNAINWLPYRSLLFA